MSSPHRKTPLQRFVRAAGLTAAAGLTFSASALAWSGTASATAPDVYDLAAQAIALESTATDPGIPTGIPFTVGSYGASSRLSSLGESAADAGAPYSPLVYSFPAFGNGVFTSTFGIGFPELPSFPGYVSAKDPITPIAKQTAGGYELIASAEPGQATGMVSIGAQAGTSEENNFFARATSLAEEDGVLSQGVAGVHALTLGGIVDIFDVSSRASLALDGSGRVVPSTSTNLGTITFAGLSNGLTGEGFTAGGNPPTPIDVSGLQSINEALKPSGITLTYLPASYTYADGTTSTATPDPKKQIIGLSSGALQIFITGSMGERGTSTETLTIGRISIGAQGVATNPAATGSGAQSERGNTPALASATGTGDGSATTAPGLDTAAAPAIDAVPAPATDVVAPAIDAVAVPGIVPGTASGLPSTAAGAPAVAAGSSAPTHTFVPAVSSGLIGQGTTSMESFYLTVAAASVLALMASQAVRVLAARRR